MNNICSSYNIKQLKKRNKTAFTRLYREYKDKILNFILIKTGGNMHIAEDVFCETFHSALKSAPALKSTDNLNSWLLQIAARRLNDHYRKLFREKRYHHDIYILKEHKIPALNHPSTDYDDSQENKILSFKAAYKNLYSLYKSVLRMKYIENLTIKDISVILNKSCSSINSILERARASLRKKFIKLSDQYINGL